MEEADDLVNDLADMVVTMQQWVNDLQSGLYVNCVYCGHRYGPADKVPSTMAEALRAHVVACPMHPMSTLAKGCKASYHALSSMIADRNGITDQLLLDVRGFLGRALNEAGITP